MAVSTWMSGFIISNNIVNSTRSKLFIAVTITIIALFSHLTVATIMYYYNYKIAAISVDNNITIHKDFDPAIRQVILDRYELELKESAGKQRVIKIPVSF